VFNNRRRLAALSSVAGAVAAAAVLSASTATSAPVTPTPNPVAASHRPATPTQTLLSAQETTVLDQPLAYPTQAPAQVSSAIITLNPGQSTGPHRHDAPMYVHILSGSVTVTYDGGVVKTYLAGQSFLEAIGTVHNGTNLGRVPVRILVVNMGAQGVANTVKL